jgi:hypothetical protein
MSLPRLSRPISAARFMSVGVFLAVVASGCDKPSFSHKPASPAGVRETFDRLRECRRNRAYACMLPYLHPSGRDATIDLLVAVDELVLADAAARAAVQRACPGMQPPGDLSGMIANRLELFSRDVEFIQAKEEGKLATVSVKIGNRLPLRHLQFERVGDTWQYMHGEAPPALVAAIRQLTRAFNQLELVLSDTHMTPEQVNEEYRLRLAPKLKKFGDFNLKPTSGEVAALKVGG